MRIENRNKTNFGWCLKTHKIMAEHALEECSLLKPYKKIVKTFVELPDYDELGQLGNWHFYSTHNHRSYLDYNGKNNALERYKFHIMTMYEDFKSGKIEEAIKHASRALHFGQDMSQPHHTQKGLFYNKIMNVATHVRFEETVKKAEKVYIQDYLKNHFIKDKITETNVDKLSQLDFVDLFLDSVKLSQKNEIPTKKNASEKWYQIGQTGFNQAMDFTRAFSKKINDLVFEYKPY